MKAKGCLIACLLVGFAPAVFAQDTAVLPVTKLELFQLRAGVVTVSGHSVVGRLHAPFTAPGKGTGEIIVTAWSLLDPLSGEKVQGISIDLEDQAKHQNTSFIDGDELDALLKGIDYLGKVDKRVTRLANFEAAFQTKGGFRISVFNAPDGSVVVGTRAGAINPVFVYLPFDDLGRFEKLISDARALLATL